MDDWASIIRDLFGDKSNEQDDTQEKDGPRVTNSTTKSGVLSDYRYGYGVDGNFLAETSTTSTDGKGGSFIKETHKIYRAGCGHLVGMNNVAPAGICTVCKQIICSECNDTRCSKCNALICKSCESILDESSLCPKCKPGYQRKKFTRKVLKAAGTAASAAHKILSKEF